MNDEILMKFWNSQKRQPENLIWRTCLKKRPATGWPNHIKMSKNGIKWAPYNHPVKSHLFAVSELKKNSPKGLRDDNSISKELTSESLRVLLVRRTITQCFEDVYQTIQYNISFPHTKCPSFTPLCNMSGGLLNPAISVAELQEDFISFRWTWENNFRGLKIIGKNSWTNRKRKKTHKTLSEKEDKSKPFLATL